MARDQTLIGKGGEGRAHAKQSYERVQAVSDELAFLAHKEGDSVAIAVRDVEPGTGSLAVLGADGRRQITVAEPIPLGHKIALVDLAENTPVIEYGEPVGLACQDIAAGELVHIHNMRSANWQLSA